MCSCCAWCAVDCGAHPWSRDTGTKLCDPARHNSTIEGKSE